MEKIVVRGGERLTGTVTVSGAKNAALPVLFATLLTRGRCVVRGIPEVGDVRTALSLLGRLGATVRRGPLGEAIVHSGRLSGAEAPYDLVKTMRASFLVLGPLLARAGHARVSTPGGCAIGSRPVDVHLDGLERLGARICRRRGYVEAGVERLRGARICLTLPSVGATENLMMAAALADGTTVIENAAREPEVEDLARALRGMGAQITGAGTDTIVIEGVDELEGFDHTVVPDRIEAGTFMVAAAATGGEVRLEGACGAHLQAIADKLGEAGAEVQLGEGQVWVRAPKRVRSVDIRTLPHPGFPTDLQAQMMALMTVGDGRAVITETIFENRFMHAQELVRLGADVKVEGNTAVVRGVPRLSGAPVMATDLRASVSLVIAGLMAENTTEVTRVYHLDRGYERLEEKLRALGARVERVAA